MKLWHLTQSHFSPFVFHLTHRTRRGLAGFGNICRFSTVCTHIDGTRPKVQENWGKGGWYDISCPMAVFAGICQISSLIWPKLSSHRETFKTCSRTKRTNWDILVFLSPWIKISRRRFSRRVFADQWDLIIHMDIHSAELVLVTWNLHKILSLNLPNFLQQKHSINIVSKKTHSLQF